MFKIVPYEAKYLPDLTRLFNLWDDIPDLTTDQMQETVDNVEKNTNNKTFLAINEEGRPVGYIFVGDCHFVGTKSFLEIIQIMIEEEYRGQGIGKLMIKYVEDLYYEKGIRQVRLHSRVILTKAHKFYEKIGFREFKQSKFFIKDLD